RAATGSTLPHDQVFVGTPDYVSPEQARNGQAADIRSDLYSLGCTFYAALAGRNPFKGTTALEILVQHLESEPIALEVFRPEVPTALATIIRRLMEKEPQKRFQTPTDLLGELDFLCGSGTAPPPPAEEIQFAEQVSRRLEAL